MEQKLFPFRVKPHPKNSDFQLFVSLSGGQNFALRKGEVSENTAYIYGVVKRQDPDSKNYDPKYPWELEVHTQLTTKEWYKLHGVDFNVDLDKDKARVQAMFTDIAEFEDSAI